MGVNQPQTTVTGPATPGRMRSVRSAPSRARALRDSSWSLRTWPWPDSQVEAGRRQLAEGDGPVAGEDLYVQAGPRTWQRAYKAGQKVPADRLAGLLTQTQVDRLLAGGKPGPTPLPPAAVAQPAARPGDGVGDLVAAQSKAAPGRQRRGKRVTP